ncbi:MAG: DUF1156 domain-containing protein [Lentisphaerae bacterium]|nr:DUF1156 domain-containing protein [Lentisphaerota bacterium]
MSNPFIEQPLMTGMQLPAPDAATGKKAPRVTSKAERQTDLLPEKLGKAVRLPVPDFSDPKRKLTCLEADFPIAQINALSNLEGNAGKPIYQMSKWWARRRSSVFRSMLIAAGTETPDDPNEAAKRVWDHYYCNHQKAGSFKNLKVLDCFMGGGTTLVEGSRLGMQMTGVDLNPVAWFVVKNELACSDPEQVRALFAHIEKQVKPQIQPFYTTTCPRGHKGRWIDVETAETVDIDPIDMPPEQRNRYRWEGPEVIYTFWAKHGPCQATGCGHRTPIFKTPVIAEKHLSADYAALTCPHCGTAFHAELGETRMAPDAERVVISDGIPFTELSQPFARLLNDYDKGDADATLTRAQTLHSQAEAEPGLFCPSCRAFAGNRLADVFERHAQPSLRASLRKKKDFGLKSKPVQMFLLIHPEWIKGSFGYNGENELGGWAGAPADTTKKWFDNRLNNLRLVEVRSKSLADTVTLYDGTIIETDKGTIPKQAQFTCSSCGKIQERLAATKKVKHTAPVAPYALQCHCPQCEAEGYTYGGRYFKTPDVEDIRKLSVSEQEWQDRKESDLAAYWPRMEIPFSMRTHVKDPLPDHGYTHWWMLFNSRQLLVHSSLMKAITEAREDSWALDVREQTLGAFQQYLRMMCMFSFWHQTYDKLAPFLSNANFNPKNNVVETNVFGALGYGRWPSCQETVIEALKWAKEPWELICADDTITAKSVKGSTSDPIVPGNEPYCGSSTDLSMLGSKTFDLVITDPPFGDNLYYADLSDFFYAWLRIPLRKWYAGLPEATYFDPERTPHSMEAIDNSVEHPDDREEHEKKPFIESKYLSLISDLTGERALAIKDPNPLYRPQPSSDFYSQTLAAVWSEAGRRLKDGGIMAFTFHHNEDSAWIDVLQALFNAGYVLVATYPIRSDETKGDEGAFGSRKIEYDIIHVCRKRLEKTEPVSWARMRRWVKEESKQLKDLLEHTHGKTLPQSDLRVILRGKSLEFYSRHYGQVFTGDNQVLAVRDALLGINQLLDDLLEDTAQDGGLRPPDSAEPASRLYMRLFKRRVAMPRDELSKTLRGTGVAQPDLEAKGWVRELNKTVYAVPVQERFAYFTASGRNRKVIKTDLDQAHFLIAAALPGSGVKIESELNNPNFRIKRSVDEILRWMSEVDTDPVLRQAAHTAAQLVAQWRGRKDRPEIVQPTLFDMLDND